MGQQIVSSSASSANPSADPSANPVGSVAAGSAASENAERGSHVDAVSVLYVIGGIPAILAFLVLLFAVGVRVCGLPA